MRVVMSYRRGVDIVSVEHVRLLFARWSDRLSPLVPITRLHSRRSAAAKFRGTAWPGDAGPNQRNMYGGICGAQRTVADKGLYTRVRWPSNERVRESIRRRLAWRFSSCRPDAQSYCFCPIKSLSRQYIGGKPADSGLQRCWRSATFRSDSSGSPQDLYLAPISNQRIEDVSDSNG